MESQNKKTEKPFCIQENIKWLHVIPYEKWGHFEGAKTYLNKTKSCPQPLIPGLGLQLKIVFPDDNKVMIRTANVAVKNPDSSASWKCESL